jgi:hypothetical protein
MPEVIGRVLERVLTIEIAHTSRGGFMVQVIDHEAGETRGCHAKDEQTAADTVMRWVELWGYGDDK